MASYTADHQRQMPPGNTPAAPANNENAAQPAEDPLATAILENSPPWLFSMAFHMLILIVMGLIVVVNIPSKPVELEATLADADHEGTQLEFDTPLGEPDVPTTAEHAMITPQDLPPTDSPYATPSDLKLFAEGSLSSSDLHAPQLGRAFEGREEGSARRTGTIGEYGATKVTENAVKMGLAWLARNQQSDGSWSLAGPYSDGVPFDRMENNAAATAMALLAFQGAGHTHRGGMHRKNVTKAWDWLLKQQDASGSFFQYGQNSHRFYTHAQCTIAACELFGMTRDEKFKEPARRAIKYLVEMQSREGGWRYSPKIDSDVSVTGWVVMALQSARMAGLEVPSETLENVTRYLDNVGQQKGSRYPYQKNDGIRLSMTAEALLMRQYLGWKRDDPRLISGVTWITAPENLVNYNENRNVYYWYYAAQVTHHMGGRYWKTWDKVMKRELPSRQQKHGAERGSWDPNHPTPDQYANQAGRLYVTCLSICMLEVYYRYLPIYTNVFDR